MSMPVPINTGINSNPIFATSYDNQLNTFTTDVGIPFHLLKRKKATHIQEVSVSTQLHGLQDMFEKFSDRTIRDDLSSFLPHLPGFIDAPATADDSLQGLIDKPPVGGRELLSLPDASLQGFRLMPGSVPEQFKFTNKPPEKKRKKKRKRHDDTGKLETTHKDGSQERKHKKKNKDDKKKKDKKKKKKKDRKGDQDETMMS